MSHFPKSESVLVGARQVTRAVRENRLRLVVLAEDADRELKDKITALCAAHSVEVRTFHSKEEMGRQAGIEVSCAVMGLQ